MAEQSKSSAAGSSDRPEGRKTAWIYNVPLFCTACKKMWRLQTMIFPSQRLYSRMLVLGKMWEMYLNSSESKGLKTSDLRTTDADKTTYMNDETPNQHSVSPFVNMGRFKKSYLVLAIIKLGLSRLFTAHFLELPRPGWVILLHFHLYLTIFGLRDNFNLSKAFYHVWGNTHHSNMDIKV